MHVEETEICGVKLIRPKIHGDERGWFAEMYNENKYLHAGLPVRYVQDNQSFSHRGTLRGLHYQLGKPQGKLIRVLSGKIYDVAVDIRRKSPTFGRWAGFDLNAENAATLWIPEGLAHGFLVLSETASVLYKTTDGYFPQGERTIRWNDPELAIAWPLESIKPMSPILSEKDAAGKLLRDAEIFEELGA